MTKPPASDSPASSHNAPTTSSRIGVSVRHRVGVCYGGQPYSIPSPDLSSSAPAMPELPEVETVLRGLAPRLEGRRIVRLIQRRRDLRVPMPAKFAERIEGRRVRRLERRAKYMLWRLDGGETLVLHLGMSGRMVLVPAREANAKPFDPHDHVVFETDDGWQIRFNDAPLRPGVADRDDEIVHHKLFAGLGPSRQRVLRRRGAGGAAERQRTPIKRPCSTSASGRRRQHLCLRGAVSRRHRPGARRTVRRISIRLMAAIRTCSAARSATAVDPARPRRPAASWAISRRASRSTTAKARPARRRIAAGRCGASCNPAARPSIARAASASCIQSNTNSTRRDAWPATKTSRPRRRAASASFD